MRNRSVRIAVAIVIMATAVAVAVIVRSATDHEPSVAAPRFDGPLTDPGVPVGVSTVPSVPGAIVSSTPLTLYNRGTTPLTITSVEPIKTDPGITLEHAAVFDASTSGGWSGLVGWPITTLNPLPTITDAANAELPPVGKTLAESEITSQVRGLVVAYRLNPDTPAAAIRGIRINYRVGDTSYALENYSSMALQATNDTPLPPAEEGTQS